MIEHFKILNADNLVIVSGSEAVFEVAYSRWSEVTVSLKVTLMDWRQGSTLILNAGRRPDFN